MAKPPEEIYLPISIKEVKKNLKDAGLYNVLGGRSAEVVELKAFDPDSPHLIAKLRIYSGQSEIRCYFDLHIALDPATGTPLRKDDWLNDVKKLLTWFNSATDRAKSDKDVQKWLSQKEQVDCRFEYYCPQDAPDCTDWRLIFTTPRMEVLQWPE